MKPSATALEPGLALALWQGLEKISDLLWERYEEDFLKLAKEVADSNLREEIDRAKESAKDLEIPFNPGLMIHSTREPE